MKNEFVYNAGNLLKKVKAGKSIFLPEYKINDTTGEWEEIQVEIKTEDEFNAYVAKHQEIKDFLETQNSKSAAKIYANAMYSLTSPANTTIAGKLLSGKKMTSGAFYGSGNIPQAKDAVYGVLNTKMKADLGILGKDVVLPMVKKTKTQVLKLLKDGIDGYYIPQIDKDGLVVTKGRGLEHFDVNFISVSSEDVTKDQLMEYFKAPFGDKADTPEAEAYIENILALCKEAYKTMAMGDDMYKGVRDIVHECMKKYSLSFATMMNPVPPVPPVPPGPVPPVPPVPPGPVPPVPPVPPGPTPTPKYGLRHIGDSRVEAPAGRVDTKNGRYYNSRVMEVYEIGKD